MDLNTILQGDCREVLGTIPDRSVQCVVTSPPYFGLRDYGTAQWDGGDPECDHSYFKGGNGEASAKQVTSSGTQKYQYTGTCPKCGATRIDPQIGLEPTVDAYVAELVAVFREVRRVLRDDGTLWLNLGSSYASQGGERTYGSYDGATGRGDVPGKRIKPGASGDSGPSRSRHAPRVPACGSDGTELRDSTDPDSAYLGLCDECLNDYRSHRDRIAGSILHHEQSQRHELTIGRDNGHQDSAGAFPDAWPRGAQESTTLESWRRLRGSCSRCDSRASVLSSLGSFSPDGPMSGHTVESTNGREAPDGSWDSHTSDTGLSSTALVEPLIVQPQYTIYQPKPKDLIPIPWLVALALQRDGWYLRQDIIWCLSGGTMVYARTQKGDMPMAVKDLYRLNPATVQLWNGEKWTQLLGMSQTSRNADELEITLRSGEKIACTPTHKFPTARGLLTAAELQPGDRLVRTTLPQPDAPLDSRHMTDDAAWFAGLYLAEGSRSGSALQIAGHVKETERWERVQAVAAAYGGSATRTIDGNRMDIRVYGKMLHALADTFVSGTTAKTKHLDPRCWRYSNAFLHALLQGYLSGDGHYDQSNNRWRLGFTRNDALAADLRTLAARLNAHLVLNQSSSEIDGTRYPTYRGELRFERSGHPNQKHTEEITSIGKARCRAVYDLGVADEPHVFALASGILTHNSKPNPMPESVRDRCTKSHEYVFLLTKSARYYYDAVAVAEPASTSDRKKWTDGGSEKQRGHGRRHAGFNGRYAERIMEEGSPKTRNRRSVWTIATQPVKEAHFATFPEALVEPCILAGTSEKGECPECGKPWVRVVERKHYGSFHDNDSGKRLSAGQRQDDGLRGDNYYKNYQPPQTTGWSPSCTCDAGDPIPQTVLDPFIGSGTVAIVSERHGRNWLGIDLTYQDIAWRRIEKARMPKKKPKSRNPKPAASMTQLALTGDD